MLEYLQLILGKNLKVRDSLELDQTITKRKFLEKNIYRKEVTIVQLKIQIASE